MIAYGKSWDKGGKRMKKIKAGVAGYGRSGFYHHSKSLLSLGDRYEIVAVCETDEKRRKEAAENLKCRVYSDFGRFAGDSDMELVSIATPSFLHPEHTIAALEAGKHVVCEKPLSDRVADVDMMIKAAKKNKKIFAPFQNRRLDPLFTKIKEVTDSGILGKIVEVKITSQDFNRRWDWQIFKKYKGGTLNDTCPHYIDWGLQFLPAKDTYTIFCQLENTLTCGDSDDHVKIVMKGKNSPLLDIEVTSSSAYEQAEKIMIMGTRGGLKGTNREIWWKYCDPDKLPARVLPKKPMTTERKYDTEPIDWKEEHWGVPENATFFSVIFYERLYETLTKGAPLYITPESVRRVIQVIEDCHRIGGL